MPQAHLLRVLFATLMMIGTVGCESVAPVATLSPLGGTWHVTAIGGQAVDHPDAPVIQFTVGGEIQGSSGCHDVRGPVDIGNGTLKVGALNPGNAAVPCAKSTQDVEAAFLAALRLVTTFREGRPGNELVLEGGGGTIVLATGL